MPKPMPGTLPVAEIFGPTFQGEGAHTGRRCSFVRLGGCNLTCEWCDTPFTWDETRFDLSKEITNIAVRDILAELNSHGTDVTVLTGGEPLMWAKTVELPDLLTRRGGAIHVETNGTITPTLAVDDQVTWYSVSPKLNTGDPLSKRVKPETIGWFRDQAAKGRAGFKFVCTSPGDVADVTGFCAEHAIPPTHVWIMPEGTKALPLTERHKELAIPIMEAGFHTTTRLHILLWGDKKGH